MYGCMFNLCDSPYFPPLYFYSEASAVETKRPVLPGPQLKELELSKDQPYL